MHDGIEDFRIIGLLGQFLKRVGSVEIYRKLGHGVGLGMGNFPNACLRTTNDSASPLRMISNLETTVSLAPPNSIFTG